MSDTMTDHPGFQFKEPVEVLPRTEKTKALSEQKKELERKQKEEQEARMQEQHQKEAEKRIREQVAFARSVVASVTDCRIDFLRTKDENNKRNESGKKKLRPKNGRRKKRSDGWKGTLRYL
eukprot:GHVU01146955.1.p3 GENE.GHVU01146955.1~~GHVU01146955.1.p3  ORF type:complete len:121 (+),score=29.11 GHVU01146955.1:182-544(+)